MMSNGPDSGSAYVFTRTGTTWTEQAKLTASDGAENDMFGGSVAIAGDTIVVGADNKDGNGFAARGSAYVFTRTGTTWTEQAKLTASDGAAGDEFGHSVAIIDGDTILVGANEDNADGNAPDSGSAYVFTGSGSSWTEQAKIMTVSDGAAGNEFGYSVAISGNTVVVGAYLADNDIGTESGSTYIYELNLL